MLAWFLLVGLLGSPVISRPIWILSVPSFPFEVRENLHW